MPDEQIKINVLYFAAASTATGLTQELVPIPAGLRLSSLGDLLISRHPNATALRKILDGSKWSVDAEMIDDPEELELKGGQEVAVICPDAAYRNFVLDPCRDRHGHLTPRAAFRATRLTPTTFLISEYNDIYGEHPQIFVKLIRSARTILIIDTGCGGATVDPDIEITSLRKFIEEVQLDCNGGRPLNEGKHMEYVVIATHCHYDHILGMEQFNDSRILASSHSPSFVSPSNLPTHSLCESMGIPTPSYTPILVPHEYAILGMYIFHTPGHTPDELAVYDAAEKMLYVGDSLYEEEAIIFPNEGSIVEWMSSIEYLIVFVEAKENRTGEVLSATKTFMEDVIAGKEPREGDLYCGVLKGWC
ncbi:Molybdopterin synthase sulfur carrier subunit [Mycena venus]|uniref:Molybdopterin synthase sulfur carrier subunit n=1 Tax=Mycena venus TaxID=2733690 RepID=A0A8H7CB36_9AGAR|nr:Molybdopterin synthase sulfur carrier subunit [Mycena venus]